MINEYRRKAQIPNMHEQSKDATLQESKERIMYIMSLIIQNEDTRAVSQTKTYGPKIKD